MVTAATARDTRKVPQRRTYVRLTPDQLEAFKLMARALSSEGTKIPRIIAGLRGQFGVSDYKIRQVLRRERITTPRLRETVQPSDPVEEAPRRPSRPSEAQAPRPDCAVISPLEAQLAKEFKTISSVVISRAVMAGGPEGAHAILERIKFGGGCASMRIAHLALTGQDATTSH